jgi:hypothetical protein
MYSKGHNPHSEGCIIRSTQAYQKSRFFYKRLVDDAHLEENVLNVLGVIDGKTSEKRFNQRCCRTSWALFAMYRQPFPHQLPKVSFFFFRNPQNARTPEQRPLDRRMHER